MTRSRQESDYLSLERGDFPTTHWSEVQAAVSANTPVDHNALASLCQKYWTPLYRLARRRVRSTHEAQDLVQGFFGMVLDGQKLSTADPGRGRFRSFLRVAFLNFHAKEREKQRATKRGGNRKILSLDFDRENQLSIEPTDVTTAERLYEREWAENLLRLVYSMLQGEYEAREKGRDFQALSVCISSGEEVSYGEISEALGCTPEAARMAASRLRCRFRELLRSEIRNTVSSADQVNDEIRLLIDIFSK